MSPVNVQFAVGAHVLAVLGYHCDTLVTSDVVARSVNVDASFARRCFANLRRAGLVRTRRGRGGASTLARPAEDISLLDVYAACDARPRLAVHHYMVEPTCPVSSDIWPVLSRALGAAQQEFESVGGAGCWRGG
jgi:Rrf2 family protein